MNITESVSKAIREEYKAGMTQEELAKKYGMSHAHIQRLLSGARPWSGLSVGLVDSMFPSASYNIHGDTVSIQADQNSGSVVGVNHTHAQDTMKSIQEKILTSDDLTAEEKVKFMQVLLK